MKIYEKATATIYLDKAKEKIKLGKRGGKKVNKGDTILIKCLENVQFAHDFLIFSNNCEYLTISDLAEAS